MTLRRKYRNDGVSVIRSIKQNAYFKKNFDSDTKTRRSKNKSSILGNLWDGFAYLGSMSFIFISSLPLLSFFTRPLSFYLSWRELIVFDYSWINCFTWLRSLNIFSLNIAPIELYSSRRVSRAPNALFISFSK